MCCVDSSWLFDWLRILLQMKAVSSGKHTGQTLKGHGSRAVSKYHLTPLLYAAASNWAPLADRWYPGFCSPTQAQLKVFCCADCCEPCPSLGHELKGGPRRDEPLARARVFSESSSLLLMEMGVK